MCLKHPHRQRCSYQPRLLPHSPKGLRSSVRAFCRRRLFHVNRGHAFATATATATAIATATTGSHQRGTPLSPPSQTSQSAYDDGHDLSCPCCPPRPLDLHLWTPQRLASVLLNERHRNGEEAFRHLVTSFRAYVQAFGCEGLRIRAERMPWYRKRSPRAGAAAAGTPAQAPPSAMTTTGVVRPPPASAQVNTDPRKRPRLA